MQTSRRRMLRGSAVALSGAVAGAVLTSSTATKARAAETSLAVAGDSLEVRNEDIAALWLDIVVEWTYAVPSGERPDTVVVDVLAGTDSDSLTVVDSAESDQVFLEASGEETFSVDLLADALEADELVPSEGGDTEDTEVAIGVEMRLYDESGLVIAADSQTDTATISIEKSAYNPDDHGAISGAGELTVELE